LPQATWRLDYTVNHLPSLTALNRFAWAAMPMGAPGTALASTGDANWRVSGSGSVAYSGQIASTLDLPGLNQVDESRSLRLPASKGTVRIGDNSVAGEWQLDQASLRNRDTALELKNIRLGLDLKDRARGLGTVTLDIGSVGAGALALVGLQLHMDSSESGDRWNVGMTETARNVSFTGLTLQDLSLQAAVRGLHRESFLTLLHTALESCGGQNMTLQGSRQVRSALRTLLASGFSVSIPSLQGSGAQGSVEGNVAVELLSAQDQPVSLARQLNSSGQLTVRGNALSADQQERALDSGFFKAIPDGFEARFAYDKGVLRVGDRTLDAPVLQLGLAQADELIQAFLASDGVLALAAPAVSQEADGPDAPAAAPPAAAASR
jgi:hypothetical protein